jgi:1,4-dihydroxy-2-naphthoate octaprenyltransferase
VSFIAHKSFRFWFQAARPPALGQSLTPYLLGTLLALSAWIHEETGATNNFNVVCVIAGFLGVAFAHCGLNLLDDYFDYTSGAVAQRQALSDGGVRARMGKCAYLAQGATPKDVAKAAVAFLGLAAGFAVVVLLVRGPATLIFAGVAGVLGYLYSGPPLKLSYHALGEVVTGIIFGLILVPAAYFVACGRLDSVAIWAAIPTGLLTINILNAHAIMDFESDKAHARITLVVALGSKERGLLVTFGLLASAYVAVGVGVLLGELTKASLGVLLSLPLAFEFWKLLCGYVRHPEIDHSPKLWYGSLGNWERIKSSGIDWFMVRWYLARNLLMMFVSILAIASFIRW